MTQTQNESAVKYERDADGIVTLTLDDPTASANTMNELYKESMAAAVDRLYDEQDDVTGVVVASAKKTFFAGGNLKLMTQATKDDAQRIFEMSDGIKHDLRRLELFPRPVVAAINGAALGGGLEITLACNHRICVDDRSVKLGLPEASLGLLPGGGGVTRTVRMLGIQSALMDVLLQGPQFAPAQAKEKGLIDELVIYVAPRLLGDGGRGLFTLAGLERLDQAVGLDIIDLRAVGRDWRVTATIGKAGT